MPRLRLDQDPPQLLINAKRVLGTAVLLFDDLPLSIGELLLSREELLGQLCLLSLEPAHGLVELLVLALQLLLVLGPGIVVEQLLGLLVIGLALGGFVYGAAAAHHLLKMHCDQMESRIRKY